MKKNLLIIGAGIYGLVAKEIAQSMGCFDRIAFVDDQAKEAPDGLSVIGTTADLPKLRDTFGSVAVAIGNPGVRLALLDRLAQQKQYRIERLLSPRAYIAASATVAEGCIVEPMAVVHALAVLDRGCLVSAGAVINHAARCQAAVHVDCNAVVPGMVVVPAQTKVGSGSVFQAKEQDVSKHV